MATGHAPKCHFFLRVPKLSKLRLPRLWRPITSFENLRLKWDLKKSCSPCWELSNSTSHITYTQVNWGNYWLLMDRNQISSLTHSPFFGNNLCFKYPNGSCKLILNIHIPKYFQWYEELFNSMRFDPWSFPLKIWKSIGTLTPKVGTHLGVWGFIPSHFPTLPGAWNVTPRLPLASHLYKPLPWSWTQS
jgi:hypothetical protein